MKAVFVQLAIIILCFPPFVDSDKIQAHQSWLWYEHDNTSPPLWQLPFVSSLFLLILVFSVHRILSFQQSKLIKASCDMSKFNTSHQLWWFALLNIQILSNVSGVIHKTWSSSKLAVIWVSYTIHSHSVSLTSCRLALFILDCYLSVIKRVKKNICLSWSLNLMHLHAHTDNVQLWLGYLHLFSIFYFSVANSLYTLIIPANKDWNGVGQKHEAHQSWLWYELKSTFHSHFDGYSISNFQKIK